MKIYLVCSTASNWMATGYGASLLHGNADKLLVSFVEFSKKPDQQLAVSGMPDPYVPTATAAAAMLLREVTPFLETQMDRAFADVTE